MISPSLSAGDGREAFPEENVCAAVELRLEREHVLHVRVVGKGHKLFKHMPRYLSAIIIISSKLYIISVYLPKSRGAWDWGSN